MNYPIEKYQIIAHTSKEYKTSEIIAMSTYAGKIVKGKAIQHENDTFNYETGKKLAIARCAAKIAIKRRKRAKKLLDAAKSQLNAAMRYVNKMCDYYTDACAEVEETQAAVENILSEIK